jgi:hypothetical protein
MASDQHGYWLKRGGSGDHQRLRQIEGQGAVSDEAAGRGLEGTGHRAGEQVRGNPEPGSFWIEKITDID